MESQLNYDHDGFVPGPLQPQAVDCHWTLPVDRFEGYTMHGPSLLDHEGMPDAYVAINKIADQVIDDAQNIEISK